METGGKWESWGDWREEQSHRATQAQGRSGSRGGFSYFSKARGKLWLEKMQELRSDCRRLGDLGFIQKTEAIPTPFILSRYFPFHMLYSFSTKKGGIFPYSNFLTSPLLARSPLGSEHGFHYTLCWGRRGYKSRLSRSKVNDKTLLIVTWCLKIRVVFIPYPPSSHSDPTATLAQ